MIILLDDNQYHVVHAVNDNAIQKHPWCKKSDAKSKAPVTSIFLHVTKGVISGRGQGLLRFNHFVDVAIYNHAQTNGANACSQSIETSKTKRTKCNVHMIVVYFYAISNYTIHPLAMAN